MKGLKNKCIGALSFLFILCAGTAFTTVSAGAQTNNAANTVGFTFEYGASVRMVAESTGLRFRALMSPEEYTALEGNTNYSDVSYGMIIAPKDYHDSAAITEESVFGISATYTVDRTDTSKTYVINLTADTLFDYTDEQANEYKCFSGAITNIATKNYVREFVAHSYIKTKDSVTGAVDYQFTATSDVRSVVYVSQIARQEGIEDPKRILSGFIQKVADVDTTYVVEHYLEGVKQEEDTQTLTAKIGETVTPVANSYKNYRAQTVEETEILANGKTVIRIDYVNTVKNILATESDLIAGNVYANKPTITSLTWEAGTIGGNAGIFKWSTTSTSNVTNTDSILRFKNTFKEQLIAGAYLYFDIYAEHNITLSGIYNKNRYNDVSNYTDMKVYSSAGVAYASGSFYGGSFKNQWVTVEIILDKDYNFDSEWWGLYMTTAGLTANTPIYLDNVKVSETPIEIVPMPEPAKTATILAQESDLIAGNVYANNASKVSLTYVAEEIGGKSGIFKWSTTSAEDINSSDAMLRFKDTFKELMKQGAYLSFDFYADTAVSLTWFGKDTKLIYNMNGESNPAVKLFDENGVLITDKTLWSGNLKNTWVTFEICLAEDYNFESSYRGLSYWSTGFNSGANIYLDNVKVSTTSLFVGEGTDL